MILCVAGIGIADYETGPDIGFSLFYLVPIVASAWFRGQRASIAVALSAAISWFIADHLTRVSLAISLWNGLTRLVIYVSEAVLIAMLREDRRREAALARTDAVTGLPNSRAFYEALEGVASQSRPLSILYIDLDHFKRINDRFGHQRGDAVLESTAAALRNTIRSSDLAARVGGDEFAVLMADANTAAADAVARRFLERIQFIARQEVEGTGFGASIGVVSAEGPITAGEILRLADDAMYEGKRQGRGVVVVRTIR